MVAVATTRRRLRGGVKAGVDQHHRIVIEQSARWGATSTGMFDVNKAFILPGVLPFLRDVFAFALDHGTDACLVVGHCDHSGEPSINDPLSDGRAKVAVAWLQGDPEPWLEHYKTRTPEDQRWGENEDQLMLAETNGFGQRLQDPGRPPGGETDIQWFQRTRNLPVTPEADETTRRQLVTEYFALSRIDPSTLQAVQGPLGNPTREHGSGENVPLAHIRAEREAVIRQAASEEGTGLASAPSSAALAAPGSVPSSTATTAAATGGPDADPTHPERNRNDRRTEFYFFRNGRVFPEPGRRDGEEIEAWVRGAAADEGFFIFDDRAGVLAEIHSDFDRSGKLDQSGAERAARTTPPGAVVTANLNVNDRTLPNVVSPGAAPQRDFFRTTAPPKDADLLPIVIKSLDPANSSGLQFLLRVTVANPSVGLPQTMATRIRINQNSGVALTLKNDDPRECLLPPLTSGTLKLTLEGRTVPGSPFGQPAALTDISYVADSLDETNFQLQLVSQDPAGTEAVHDLADYSLAPLIVADRLATPDRIYLCTTPENEASVVDVKAALASIPNVKLVLVPESVANGDTWLQDQYQLAVTRMPGGPWRQLLLHLPRQQRNMSIDVVGSNLAVFVDAHFPSERIGVVSDLREREAAVVDANGGQHSLKFAENFALYVLMQSAISAEQELEAYCTFAQGSPTLGNSWDTVRTNLTTLHGQTIAAIDARLALSGLAQLERDQLRARRLRSDEVLADVDKKLPLSRDAGGNNLVTVPIDKQNVAIDMPTSSALFTYLEASNSSGNFGGNIEATPPFAGAPFGKIIVGNVRDAQIGDHVDPALLRLLSKQHKQAIVEIDSTWLQVGHIDEFMAIVPDSRKSGAFAFLKGSAQAAIELLRSAHRRYLNGLNPNHPHRVNNDPTTPGFKNDLLFTGDLTAGGTSPVTRLLRGKGWLHVHAPGGNLVADSPKIHQRLSEALNRKGAISGTSNLTGYVPGTGRDRRYRASISIRELLFGELDNNDRSSNDFLETEMIAPAFAVLAAACPTASVLPLPVLFDRGSDTVAWKRNHRAQQTIAFVPDLANLQVLGKHLLIPRPYGPRMLPADAIFVVQEAMTTVGVPASVIAQVSTSLIAANKMGIAKHWIEPFEGALLDKPGITTVTLFPGLSTEQDIVGELRDSFPGASAAQLTQQIIQPNAQFFTGSPGSRTLQPGFHLFSINDGMVDIFELFALAVVKELGLTAHFVDSWFYHIHEGGIHCGTNVLAQPPDDGSIPDPWTVPDIPELQ
jgi:hypothetical protein